MFHVKHPAFMKIYLYTFSKNTASTKLPTADTAFEVTGTLIEDCDLVRPTIYINFGKTSAPAYNYMYIPEFSRYYWIDSWTWTSGLWRATAHVDFMASWKTNIGNHTEYILRSAAASDGDICDNYYPTKAGITITYTDITGPAAWSKYYKDGTYILGVIGANAVQSLGGAATYYIFDQDGIKSFFNTLLSNIDWANISVDEISQNLQKAIFNPIDYIVSCMWFPWKIDVPPSGELDSIPLGWWTLPANCALLSRNDSLTNYVWTANIPKHPQAASRGNYLNLSPYSRYLFWGSPFGTVPLDSTLLAGRNKLRIEKTVDYITGIGMLNIAVDDVVTGNSQHVALQTAQVGIPIQIAQITADYFQAITETVGTIGNIASGAAFGAANASKGMGLIGGVAGGLVGAAESAISSPVLAAAAMGASGGVAGIAGAVEAAFAQVRSGSTTGTNIGYQYTDHVIGYFTPIVAEDNEHLGRPLCQRRKISTLPGFIMTLGCDIEFPGTAEEVEAVKQQMDTGFYYE